MKTEREAADALVKTERNERDALLHELLGAERTATDRRLASERTYADEQLATRDRFLRIVSHDVRTLIGGISLNAQSILRQAPEDDTGARIRNRAEGIQRYAQRMTRLVDDLLDAVSMDAGHFSVTPERHDATQLLLDTIDAFRSVAADKGIRLDVHAGQGHLLVWLDELRILQVLTNLLSNAAKYSPEQSVISISVEQTGPEVMFTVRDQGVGIPRDLLETVFERFYQVSTGERRGFGLGLFIAKSIVEAHGGRIWAESAPGRGSTFKFTLPSAAP